MLRTFAQKKNTPPRTSKVQSVRALGPSGHTDTITVPGASQDSVTVGKVPSRMIKNSDWPY